MSTRAVARLGARESRESMADGVGEGRSGPSWHRFTPAPGVSAGRPARYLGELARRAAGVARLRLLGPTRHLGALGPRRASRCGELGTRGEGGRVHFLSHDSGWCFYNRVQFIQEESGATMLWAPSRESP